jgi:hypothetical protein
VTHRGQQTTLALGCLRLWDEIILNCANDIIPHPWARFRPWTTIITGWGGGGGHTIVYERVNNRNNIIKKPSCPFPVAACPGGRPKWPPIPGGRPSPSGHPPPVASHPRWPLFPVAIEANNLTFYAQRVGRILLRLMLF